jgi:Flp pilus assembly protein TadD
MESENPESKPPHSSKGDGSSHRHGQWRLGLRLRRIFSRVASGLHDFCFPLSERSHGYSGYSYSRPARQNRVKWLWRRLRRLVRKSFVGSTVSTLKARWYDWWHPVSDEGGAYYLSYHSSYHGGVRRHRLVRDWHRLKRFVRRSFVGRAYKALASRFYDWWYPVTHKTNKSPTYGYGYGYGSRRRNRLQLVWRRVHRRIRSSWLGRKYRVLANALFEWYFPLVKSSGRYGYGSYSRVSRPMWLMRRGVRWFRRTWLGRKTGWMLDEAEDIVLQVCEQAAQDFAWRKIRHRLKRWQTWAMLVCLIAVIGLAHKYVLPRYHKHVERNYAMQAERFAAKGDFSRAILRARQLLNMNADNTTAIRVIADVADYFGSPYALQWRQRLVFLNPDSTNRLALARTALRAEAFPFPTATKALNDIATTNRQSSAYQLVAGALAIKLNDLQSAEQHYEEALKLNPNDPANRMSLAVVRLQSGDPKLITDSRTTLELLRTDRQIGLLAARSLVGESVARREFARAEAFSQQILTNQQVSFSDRIVHLAILNIEKSPRFATFLAETKKSAEENPFYVGELVSWMNRSGYAQSALDWVNGLPPRLSKSGLVPIAVADSYVSLGQWKGLTAYLLKEHWMEMDAVRIGMMSFASWKDNGSKQYSSAIWQQAVLLAEGSPTMLNTLAEMAAGWGWKEETEDVLWSANRKYPFQSWPLTTLERLYTGQRDTAGLRRVFRAMVERDPKDAQARNNYAMVSLLLGTATDQARQIAAELHAAEPDNPVFVSTYAFSLYQQGHPQEAVQALRALGLNRLDDPALAAYYGVFLAAAGDKQTARTYLNKAAKAFLLPQEQALVARAKQTL